MKKLIHIFGITSLFFAPLAGFCEPPEQASLRQSLCPTKPTILKKLINSNSGPKLDEILDILETQNTVLGKCQKASIEEADKLVLTYPGAKVKASFKMVEGKLTKIEFGAAIYENDSFDKIDHYIKKELPEKTSLYVWDSENGTLHSYKSELLLNISRSVQIMILNEIFQNIQNGKFKKTDLITIDDKIEKYPYGRFSNWPNGSKHTLDTLLSLAILDSDFYALDILSNLVGYKEILKQIPANKELISFAQHIKLTNENNNHEHSHSNTPIEEKEISKFLKSGWNANGQQICQALYGLKNEDIFSSHIRNKIDGDLEKQGWDKMIAYHTRDPGISQTSILLKHKKKQKMFCIALTSNSKEEIPEIPYSLVVDRAIRLLPIQ